LRMGRRGCLGFALSILPLEFGHHVRTRVRMPSVCGQRHVLLWPQEGQDETGDAFLR
jgi:hypothetical protein